MNPRLHLFDILWHGVVAKDFTLEQVRRRCFGLGTAMVAQNYSCIVAYDTRFMSNLFAHDVYQRLAAQGVAVSLVPTPAPLPAVQLALDNQPRRCAIYISARNQPYWYNGMVLLSSDPNSLSLQPAEGDLPPLPNPESELFPASGGAAGQPFLPESTVDARKTYLDRLRELIDLNLIHRVSLTIFSDPMHGTLAGYLPAVIGDGSYTKAIEINREIDPLFGKLTPLPTVSALSRLSKLVRESDSHIGLAFSADGTALGVVDKNGEHLEQLEIILLLASYLSTQYRHKGVVVAPLPAADSPFAKAVDNLSTWEAALGFKVELVQDATERIREMVTRDPRGLLVGCTSQGEMVMSKYSLCPDALIAGLLIVELVARNGGSLRTSLDNLRTLLSAPE